MSDDENLFGSEPETDNEEQREELRKSARSDRSDDDEDRNTSKRRSQDDQRGEDDDDDVFGDREDDNDDLGRRGRESSSTPVREITQAIRLPTLIHSYQRQQLESDVQIFYARIPSTLSAEPTPFDPEQYRMLVGSEKDEKESNPDRIQHRVQNTIRWRYRREPNGDMIKESNARLIRWSNNTYSLAIGQQILYDVSVVDMKNQMYLTAQHPAERMLETQLRFTQEMNFRALAGQKFSGAVGAASGGGGSAWTRRPGRAKVVATVEDPERVRLEEEKKAKVRRRLEVKQQSYYTKKGLNARDLEEFDDFDRDSDDQDDRAARRLNLLKRGRPNTASVRSSSFRRDDDDDEEDDDFIANDEADDERGMPSKRGRTDRSSDVDLDDDGDEEEEGRRADRRKRRADRQREVDEQEDVDVDGEGEMDVDEKEQVEEEEPEKEDVIVRKTVRRRVVESDEED
ncbi:Leo1-like protein-domain-containing protein [Cladochytrium replicatum]|nr:Leo1-like protein-domain-containing protein [Cladochytrium replicatum]